MARAFYCLVVLVISTCACGRVNYDPLALSGDTIDAGREIVDADPNAPDADPNAPDADLVCDSALRTGSYVGDGMVGRVISTGMRPAFVIVQSEAGNSAVIRIDTMPFDMSKSLVGVVNAETNLIFQIADGFALGDDNRVNAPGETYHWIAMPKSANLSIGSYTGNGTGQTRSGLGFRPEWILFAGEADVAAVVRTPQAANLTFRLDDGSGVPSGVTSLDVDGFTLGTRPFVNAADIGFHYVAWRSSPETIKTGGYLGDDAADHVVGGLGIEPSYLITHAEDKTVMHRFATLPTGSALPVVDSLPIDNTIKSFAPDSFALGAQAESMS